MNIRCKLFFFLLTVATAIPAAADPFRPYRKPQTPPFSFNIGIGTSHGGEDFGGIIITPVGGGSYYSEDFVNLGGEQSYFFGGILPLSDNSEIWMSFGQMYDEAKPGQSHDVISDPNFNLRLDHDRYEFMYFFKTNRVRVGAGLIFDRDIGIKYRSSTNAHDFKFDNAKGWGLGAGIDMPFNSEGGALHFDIRYIKMIYHINDPAWGYNEEDLSANSIGYFLSVSF